MKNKKNTVTVNRTAERRNAMLRLQDLVDNPMPRVPVCLCLDTSGSMGRTFGGTRTGETVFRDGKTWNVVTGGVSCREQLQSGIEQFYAAVRGDETAKYSAEIAIVSFNDRAECIEDFASLERQTVPELVVKGNTAMGEGVNLALDLLEKRKAEYRAKGVDYFQPWLILMTDGEPNGDRNELLNAIDRVNQSVNAGKLTVFPIGIGRSADMDTLNRFSPKRQAMNIQSVQFGKFFNWLSKSISAVSKSCPGDAVALDISAFKDLGLISAAKEGGWLTL